MNNKIGLQKGRIHMSFLKKQWANVVEWEEFRD